MRTAIALVASLAAIVLVGCNATPGSQRPLGQVNYPTAFAEARQVMQTHFTIAQADADTGVIRAQPKRVDTAPGQLLTTPGPTRQVATMHLKQREGQLVAFLDIAIQRQSADSYRVFYEERERYSDVPNQSPAMQEAATTPEQNQLWQTERNDKTLERKILQELYARLHEANGT